MSTPIELQRVVFEGSDPGPHLLITGGVHGDEFEEQQEVSVRLIEDTLFASGIYLSSKTIPLVTNKSAIGFSRFTVNKPGDTLLTIPLTMTYGNLLLIVLIFFYSQSHLLFQCLLTKY